MPGHRTRLGSLNPLVPITLGSVVLVAGLLYLLWAGTQSAALDGDRELVVFCAAGIRFPIERIVDDYTQQFPATVQIQYGGSNTLLNQIEVNPVGDLFVAGDSSFIETAISKGLVKESIPLARLRPVIVVPEGNPRNIAGLDDLMQGNVRVALGNPDATAVGRSVRAALLESGKWQRLEAHVTDRGVFKPTVNDVANDVVLGSVDAGIVWTSILPQYPGLRAIDDPSLAADPSLIEIGVLHNTADSVAALHLARFIAARDRGLKVFERMGYEPVDGDVWASRPTITFYAGAVNRRVLEPTVQQFEQREGVRVHTVYNGCGILTAQMRSIVDQQGKGFPDAYMACDVYYLKTVNDWFQEAKNVSETDIVMVVPEGNPKHLTSLDDLLAQDVRVAVGQPDQCTIGVLTRRLLSEGDVYQRLRESGKIVAEVPTSAMLVPAVITGSADVVFAYVSDTLAEADRVDVVPIRSSLARAVQPFGIARISDHKYLARRLFGAIADARARFEQNGFRFRLGQVAEPSGAGKD